MLEWFFLCLFAGGCALLVKDGFSRPAGIFEFPFLAGVGMSSFLLIQAIGVVRAGDIAPSAGVIKMLFISTLCCLAIYCGWRGRTGPGSPPPVGTARTTYRYALGLGMLALGFWGRVKLGSLSGGVIEHYSAGGAYALEWRGLAVIYAFVAHYLEAGFIFVALASFRRGSRVGLVPVVAALAFLLADMILLGRRMQLAFVLLALGLLGYFWRRWTPPRAAVIAAACLGAASLFVLPYYRAHSQLGGDWGALTSIRPGEILREVFEGSDAEFSNAAYLVQVTEEQGIFQYGIGFYNTLIRYFVPKALVGEEGKERLLVAMPDAGHVGPEAGVVPNRYGWAILPYIVPTGPASVFQQFWYFGALCFYILARWLKGYWLRAVRGDLWSQAVYTLSAAYAVSAVVTDVYVIYHPVVMFVLPGLLALRIRDLVRKGSMGLANQGAVGEVSRWPNRRPSNWVAPRRG
jgi:hypothetical protein